jgi:hypothetical protein
MSMPHSDSPYAPDFHPEFGLLCPSRRRRRSIRLAMVSVIAGMAIGATIELAVAHWRDGDFAQSPVATAVDEESLAEGTAIQAVPDIPVALARPSTSAAGAYDLTATRSQAFCKDTGAKDLAAEFLNPACESVKLHARHSAQTTSRVATVIIGRAESSSAPAAAGPMPVTVSAVESSYTVVSAGKTVIPTAQLVERRVPPKKPKAAPSTPIVLASPNREPAQKDAGSFAFAAVHRSGTGYYDRPGDIFRGAAMPPSSGGPFGGIW